MSPLLRLSDVLRFVGLEKSHIYNLISEGNFPRPVKIGRASRWPEREIEAWVSARVAERDEGAQ